MTKEEISTIVTEALKPLTTQIAALEAKAKSAETAAAAKGADTNIIDLNKAPEFVSLEARLKAIETNTGETVKASAKATVQTIGIRAGRIAAQDAETIKFWEEAIAANAKAAEALAKMPVNPALATIVANASAGGTSTVNGLLPDDKATADKIAPRAKALKKDGTSFSEAWALAKAELVAGK